MDTNILVCPACYLCYLNTEDVAFIQRFLQPQAAQKHSQPGTHNLEMKCIFIFSDSFPVLPTVVSGPRHHNHCLSPYREEAQLPEGPVEHCQQTAQTGAGHRAPCGEFTAKFFFFF